MPTTEYYSVAVDRNEAMLGSMDLYRILTDTEAVTTVYASDDDPRLYVLYDTPEHRDAGYEALKDRFRSTVVIYSTYRMEDNDADQADC